MIYSVTLVSDAWQSEPVVLACGYPPFKALFPHRPFQGVERGSLCYAVGPD